MKHTRFRPQSHTLTVRLSGDSMPSELLGMLIDEQVLAGIVVMRKWGARVLVLTLSPRTGLPASASLERLALRLSLIPGAQAVYDPWTIGGQPVDLDRAAQFIGDVIRSPNGLRLACKVQ